MEQWLGAIADWHPDLVQATAHLGQDDGAGAAAHEFYRHRAILRGPRLQRQWSRKRPPAYTGNVPRLVLFDIDLTLVRTNGAGRAAMTEASRRLFGIENPTEGISFDGRTDYAIFMEAIQLNHLAGGDPAAVYRQATEAYLEMLPGFLVSRGGEVLPGVADLLDALLAEGVPVGLATGNLRRGAMAKLGYFGLWERFSAGGFGDDTPNRSEVVTAAISNLATAAGVDPNPASSIVVGDTPLDVAAAHAAGAKAVAVATGSYDMAALRASGARHVVPDLSETAALIEILLG